MDEAHEMSNPTRPVSRRKFLFWMSGLMTFLSGLASHAIWGQLVPIGFRRKRQAGGPPAAANGLWVWGDNDYGMLGLGDSSTNEMPVQVGTLSDWKITSGMSGAGHAIAIKSNGTLWAWGNGTQGRLGLNDNTTRSSPVQIGTLLWSQVSIGTTHSLALRTDGTLWSWGANTSGELGLNDRTIRSSPTQVGSLTDWAQVAGGSSHSLAVKTNGTLWSWGSNATNGELGLSDNSSRSSPTQVGSLNDWSKVSGDFAGTLGNSFAIKVNKTLWAWGGGNSGGALGLGDVLKRSSPSQVGSSNGWSRIGPAGTMSKTYTIATRTDGTLWSWGTNSSGELGLGDTTDRSSPVQVGLRTDWQNVAGGEFHFLASTSDGTLWTWGVANGNNYRLGLGDKLDRSSPTQIGNDTNWVVLAPHTSDSHSIKYDGTLWSWGVGAAVAGIQRTDRSSPVLLPSAMTWKQVDRGNGFFMALKTDGTLWAWGTNASGQLGLGHVSNKWSPTQVGGTNWSVLAAGVSHTLAIKSNGTLWSWGGSANGQLGLGDIIERSSAIQVGSLTTWSKISGAISSLALRSDGTLWTWGDNSNGKLGLGDVSHRSSPAQVGSLTTWSKVVAGYNHSLALKADGSLWAWGDNTNGNLGQSNRTLRSSPVQVGAGTTWLQIATGNNHSIAIRNDATLWTWGINSQGELGIGTVASKSSPTQVGTLAGWYQVATVKTANIAMRTDGTLWSWGYNLQGNLGLGDASNRSSPVQIGNLTDWNDPIFGNQNGTDSAGGSCALKTT